MSKRHLTSSDPHRILNPDVASVLFWHKLVANLLGMGDLPRHRRIKLCIIMATAASNRDSCVMLCRV